MDQLGEDQIIYDPLTPTTRGERRLLLGISGAGIAIAKVPLIPTKIGFLGIEFQNSNQATFLTMFSALILFLAIAFVIYALTDFAAWRRMSAIRITEYARASAIREADLTDAQRNAIHEKRESLSRIDYGGTRSWNFATVAAYLRVTFEFGVPVILAGYALFALQALSNTLR